MTGVPRGMRDFASDTSRGLAAGALLSAVVHLDLWQQGFRDIHTIEPLILLNAIAGLVIGAALNGLAEYATVFFGLAAAAVLWQAMRENVA